MQPPRRTAMQWDTLTVTVPVSCHEKTIVRRRIAAAAAVLTVTSGLVMWKVGAAILATPIWSTTAIAVYLSASLVTLVFMSTMFVMGCRKPSFKDPEELRKGRQLLHVEWDKNPKQSAIDFTQTKDPNHLLFDNSDQEHLISDQIAALTYAEFFAIYPDLTLLSGLKVLTPKDKEILKGKFLDWVALQKPRDLVDRPSRFAFFEISEADMTFYIARNAFWEEMPALRELQSAGTLTLGAVKNAIEKTNEYLSPSTDQQKAFFKKLWLDKHHQPDPHAEIIVMCGSLLESSDLGWIALQEQLGRPFLESLARLSLQAERTQLHRELMKLGGGTSSFYDFKKRNIVEGQLEVFKDAFNQLDKDMQLKIKQKYSDDYYFQAKSVEELMKAVGYEVSLSDLFAKRWLSKPLNEILEQDSFGFNQSFSDNIFTPAQVREFSTKVATGTKDLPVAELLDKHSYFFKIGLLTVTSKPSGRGAIPSIRDRLQQEIVKLNLKSLEALHKQYSEKVFSYELLDPSEATVRGLIGKFINDHIRYYIRGGKLEIVEQACAAFVEKCGYSFKAFFEIKQKEWAQLGQPSEAEASAFEKRAKAELGGEIVALTKSLTAAASPPAESKGEAKESKRRPESAKKG
ncbi:MAG: hypothetical protein H0X51_06125 [Parachlamydiaceae bacterium]|nr:hypothetical protein [Parachlamydiaceae bacterium]